LEDHQPQRRPERPEAREYRPVRRRKAGIRFPFGFVIALALFAVVLQATGTVDLGIPIGALGVRAPAANRPVSLEDSQADLRRVVASAAKVVGGGARPQTIQPEAGSAAAPVARAASAADGPQTQTSAWERQNSMARPVDGDRGLDDSPASAETLGPLEMAAEPQALPAIARRMDGYRSAVEQAWFSGGANLSKRALNARNRALQLGANNYEAASRALLAPAASGERLQNALLAARLAPDLPMARMELSAAYFEDGQYLNAAREVVTGIRAIPRNLEATLWLAASLVAMFAAVLTLGSLTFIVWVGVSVFRRAAHDLGDLVSKVMPEFARAALLASALLIPVLVGEALMGLVVGLFLLGFMYCEPGYRRALVLAAVLLVLGLYPVTRLAGLTLTALDSDPVAAAADAVIRGMTAPADIETLVAAADGGDWLADASLALHERRSGDPDAALARYERLLERTPTDPVVLSALSNMYFARGENERAIQLGERASALTRSATLLFNLSQVYARTFRMEEFESAMAQAQLVDSAVVADLSRARAPDFVGDLAFPLGPIRDRMIRGAGGDPFVDALTETIMPGRIGQNWMATAGSFCLAAMLGVLLGGRWEHASHCGRCGRRICNRCDGTVWNSQICDACHHLFHRPETTDAAMRMARLSELRDRETRIGRLAMASSVLVPGVGGLLAKRPDLSFLGLICFAWAGILFLWRDGVVVDPLAVGAAGPIVFALAGSAAVLGYGLVVTLGLLIRRNL
jgi:tetratricopeptide (TPR) repeat protein